MDCGPPGSSAHEIFQARILEWVALFLSPGYLPNPGIEPGSPVLQADSLPTELQGKPFPHPESLSDPGIKPASLVSAALAGGFFITEPAGKPLRGLKRL